MRMDYLVNVIIWFGSVDGLEPVKKKNKPYVFCTVYVFCHNISGTLRAVMIMVSEAKIEAKIVHVAFTALYTSRRELTCTFVLFFLSFFLSFHPIDHYK
jgi:hypothetical protein